jgi:Zn-dependent protease
LDSLSEFLLVVPVLLFSMVAHEYAHGYAALRHGDPTAYELGRLTWNPARHIDPFMTIIMPLITFFGSYGSMMFGGAKPVPVNPRNYRNYRRADIVVSLAGIAVNLALAAIFVPAIIGLGLLGRALPAANDTLALIQYMLVRGIQVNLILAMFNLMPIPPLDGSHVLKHVLPPAWSLRYQAMGGYGLLILLLLLTVGRPVISFWMQPAVIGTMTAWRTVASYVLPSPWTS